VIRSGCLKIQTLKVSPVRSAEKVSDSKCSCPKKPALETFRFLVYATINPEVCMNHVVLENLFPSGQRLQLVQGDLTEESVDAIVNAANSALAHGGGVAGAIARKGGPQIQDESDRWVLEHGPVRHAEPAYTRAGRLPCRYVIHAVGPVWGEGDEDAKLSAAVGGSLALADKLALGSLSLPAISTGIFGFPKERAARLILSAIYNYLGQNPASGLTQIRLVVIDQPTLSAFQNAWKDKGLGIAN
jgi:O-acetyl-ADP-ribose deacetylase (regulator of RNase III)